MTSVESKSFTQMKERGEQTKIREEKRERKERGRREEEKRGRRKRRRKKEKEEEEERGRRRRGRRKKRKGGGKEGKGCSFNETGSSEKYSLSLHDALPI